MSELAKTSDALAQLAANQYFDVGEHIEDAIRVGGSGFQIGTVNFDPVSHNPLDRDMFSVFGMATGQDQVRLMLPERPLRVNVISDYTSVSQHPALADTKRSLAEDLSLSIGRALPGMTDRTHYFAIGDSIPEDLSDEVEAIPVDNTEILAKEVADIAMDGLTFVISGFNELRLVSGEPLSDTIAIKVNHPLDRRIPANIGIVGIQGLGEVNTRKSKSLGLINDRLELRHQGIVKELEESGAVVASVVATLRDPSEYDLQAADTEIASAISRLQ